MNSKKCYNVRWLVERHSDVGETWILLSNKSTTMENVEQNIKQRQNELNQRNRNLCREHGAIQDMFIQNPSNQFAT